MTARHANPVLRQLRDFAFGTLIALVIAVSGFVAMRNHELAARQLDLATRAVEAIATDRSPLPSVHAVLLGAATPSQRHPFLRHRQVRDATGWRPLVAGGSPDDKLFYDAATRFERTGAFAELLRDGSGRALAARPHPSGIAVAVTPSARPAAFPLLVLIGVLGLGAALAAAGALIGGRAARAGTFAGVSVLAIPCALWRSPIAATAIVVVAAGLAVAQHAQLTDRFARAVRQHRTALGFLAPAAVAMLVLVAAPFVIGLVLGFYDHHHGTWQFVGLDNFGEILSGGGRPLDDPLNFWFILGVTVLWTVANVALHVALGVALAIVLSRSWLRGRGVFRMLFILPWAVPNYITALIWKGMFTGEYGA